MPALLNFFVHAQCLAALGALLAWGLGRVSRALSLTAAPVLRLHYAFFTFFGLLLLLPFVLPQEQFVFHPVAHVDAGRVARGAITDPATVVRLPGAAPRSAGVPLGSFAWGALLLTLAGLAVTAADYLRLRHLLRRATVFRRLGRVRVAVSENIASPLSTRGPGVAWVVLPPSFLHDPLALRIAIAHELQHHRAGDTAWCHAFAPLRALCFFHPLRALWAAAVAEAQELACDEVLVRQKRRISAGDYSRCLIRAAELAARRGDGRAYAAALGFSSARRLLARRIENMYENNKKQNGWIVLGLSLFVGATLAAGAWGSGRWVVDTRVTGRKMVEMAEKARQGTDFPIQVNELVLRELNYYLGTEKGREFVRRAKANLAAMRPELEREIADHRVPEELLGVAFAESGFENLPASANPTVHGAGVWQFIPSTARLFGMRVDEEVDERLNVDQETEAAFRYLSANQQRFGDWLLGIMAYNMGERSLEDAIHKTGTRDPWQLMRLGYGNDYDYLARVMAGILILKNDENSR